MQVLCMASNDEQADVVCATCGQRYAIYYSRPFTSECEGALASVLSTLLEHHANDATAAAHPGEVFNVPAWSGHAHMSAAALLSNAPVRRRSQNSAPERLAS
jgi:hypothetical protein